MRRKKSIRSWDCDGAILPIFSHLPRHRGTGNNYQPTSIYNAATIEKIVAEYTSLFDSERPEEVVFLVGSNRQDPFSDLNALFQQTDELGTFTSGSCYVEIEAFAYALRERLKGLNIPVRVDPFLMLDVCHQKEHGSTFEEAKAVYGKAIDKSCQACFQLEKSVLDHMKWVYALRSSVCNHYLESYQRIYTQDKAKKNIFDRGKLSLLYAQMHKVASKDPDCVIDFHFYDDHFESILLPLQHVFHRHPELIPNNMRLHLHHYRNGKQQYQRYAAGIYKPVIDVIEGAGDIDLAYEKNVLEMIDCAANSDDKIYCDGVVVNCSVLEGLFDVTAEGLVTPKEAYATFHAKRVVNTREARHTLPEDFEPLSSNTSFFQDKQGTKDDAVSPTVDHTL